MKIYFFVMIIIFFMSVCDSSFGAEGKKNTPKPRPGKTLPADTDSDEDSGNPWNYGDRDADNPDESRDSWDNPGGQGHGDKADVLGVFYQGSRAQDAITYLTVKEWNEDTKNSIIALHIYLKNHKNSPEIQAAINTAVVTGTAVAAVWMIRALSLHPYGRVAAVAAAGTGFSGVILAGENVDKEAEKIYVEQSDLVEELSDSKLSIKKFLADVDQDVKKQDSLLGFLNTIYPSFCYSDGSKEKRYKEEICKRLR